MKPIKILIINLLLMASQLAVYADCRLLSIGEARYINYVISDIVFLGIPIQIEGNTSEFIVIEEYKGNIDKKITVVFDNIDKDDIFSLWLIYGSKPLDNDTVYVHECSLTRSANNLGGSYRKFIPPPRLETNKNKEENVFLDRYLVKIQFRNDFYDEIEILRELKKYNSAKDIDNFKSNSLINKDIINIIMLSCLLVIIVLLFCVFLKLRKFNI